MYVRACVCAFVRACVHACVRACVCACVCAYVRMYVRVYVRACVRAYVRACVRACGRPCVHMCVCTYVRAYVRSCVRECVRACARVHVMRACVRTCVRACVRARRGRERGVSVRACVPGYALMHARVCSFACAWVCTEHVSCEYFSLFPGTHSPANDRGRYEPSRSLIVIVSSPPTNPRYARFHALVNRFNEERPFRFPNPFGKPKKASVPTGPQHAMRITKLQVLLD